MTTTLEIPLFPLHTALYPQGRLPLRIFETRYVDMTKRCIGNDEVFGVCPIREGHEVGAPATPEPYGCTARIVDWEVPSPGLFRITASGEQRFRVRERYTAPSGLMHALVQIEPALPVQPLPGRYSGFAALLRDLVSRLPAGTLPEPLQFDDAAWVAWRLGDILPLRRETRLWLLEATEAEAMLDRIAAEFPIPPG